MSAMSTQGKCGLVRQKLSCHKGRFISRKRGERGGGKKKREAVQGKKGRPGEIGKVGLEKVGLGKETRQPFIEHRDQWRATNWLCR